MYFIIRPSLISVIPAYNQSPRKATFAGCLLSGRMSTSSQ